MPRAYRILTPRLCIRPFEVEDAPALVAVIEASLDHLRGWLRWAQEEPQTIAQKAELIRTMRDAFDAGESLSYGLYARDHGAVLGGAGLHRRIGEGGLEIGYWLRHDALGAGLASEAAAALTRVAFEIEGCDRVEIHMDPRNARSAAVPARLGFTHVATHERDSFGPDGEPRDTMVWRITAGELPIAALSGPIEAFDARGDRIAPASSLSST
jgi:RimJ/RimL family protein N-acetyltransferase